MKDNSYKLEKERLKREAKKQKKIEYYNKLKQKKIEQYKKKIEDKYNRLVNKYNNNQDRIYEKKKRKIEGKKPLKKHLKQPSKERLKQKYLKALQLYARLRDTDAYGYGNCISCGRRLHRNMGDGGHYISRRNLSTAFDLRNIHLQCKHCNGQLHGNPIGYRQTLVEKYGEAFVLKLESDGKKTTTEKFTIEDYKRGIEEVNEMIKQSLIEKNDVGQGNLK